MTRDELILALIKLGVRKVRGVAIERMNTYALMRVHDWMCDKDSKLSELPVLAVVVSDVIHCECCGNTMTRDEFMENNSECLFCD